MAEDNKDAVGIEGQDEPEGALIKVFIISASALRDSDKGFGQGKSDPYCILRLAGKKEVLTQTRVIDNNLNPVWNHEPVDIDNFDLEDALEFEIRDKDPGRTDLLGKIRVEAEKLMPYGWEGEIDLEETRGSESKLKIKVDVERIPKSLRKDARKAAQAYADDEARAQGAIVEISIKGATGLRNADRMGVFGGKSDPYCIVKKLPGSKIVMRTKVVENTLDPTWDHPPFEVERVPLEGPAFEFEVRDKDPGRAGDILGTISLDSTQFLPQGFEGPLLMLNGGKGFTPSLLLKITVISMPPDAVSKVPGGLRGAMILCCGPPSLDDQSETVDHGAFDPDNAGSISGILAAARNKMLDVAGAIDDVVEDAVVAVEDVVHSVKKKLNKRMNFWSEFTTKFSELIDNWMKDQIKQQLEVALDSMPAVIKSALNGDPDMVQWVWHKQCRVVDTAWPDVRRELMRDLELMLGIVPPEVKARVNNAPGPGPIRAYFRYHLYPYNRSFWGKSRSWIYIIFTMGIFIPESAVSALFIFGTFLIIDKSDEYQLVQFILSTKAAQFVAHFLLRTVIGYILFLDCVTGRADVNSHTCAKSGPGVVGPAWFVMLGWLVQTLLPWFAVLFLSCVSVHKGMKADSEDSSDDDDDDDKDKEPKPTKFACYKRSATAIMGQVYDSDKRHLRRVLYYDAVCQLTVIAVMAWSISTNGGDLESYIVRMTFLGCQVTYGLMAMPFFLFGIPMVEKVLLHIRRTGYDEMGRVRFFKGAEKPPRTTSEDMTGNITALDKEEIMGQLLGCFGMGPERIEDGVDLFHTYEATTLIRASACCACKGKLRGAGSKAMVCSFCGDTICMSCNNVIKNAPCKKKETAKVKQDEQDKEDGDEEQKKAAEGKMNKVGSWERFSKMEDYWKMTRGFADAIRQMGSGDADSCDQLGQFIDIARVWVKKQSHGYIEALVTQLPIILKNTLEEPDMPPRVKKAMGKVVDGLWDEMSEEIMYQMKVAIDGRVLEDRELDKIHPGVDCCRAKLRYSFMPYNKSIWWQIKNPYFWALTLLPLIPVSICVPFTFLVIWIFIDKQDEFQLISFIMRFKGTQFITFGLIKNVIGFYSYINCTTHPLPGHTCDKNGPGTGIGTTEFYFQLFGLVVECFLTWSCFALLPFSKDKARSELSGDLEAPTPVWESGATGALATAEGAEGAVNAIEVKIDVAVVDDVCHDDVEEQKKRCINCEQGGHLRWLGLYDFVCASFCFGLLILLYYQNDWTTTWVVEQGFFALYILYGYLAMPFFFFNLPVLKTVLTHSVESGYDEKGRVRALEGPPPKDAKIMEEQLKIEEDKQKKREGRVVKVKDDSEEKGLVEKLKELVNNTFVGDDDDNDKDKDEKDK
eukprot:CAMPEP_0203916522 /NCGR_PEP_ID=MMETSP0359-20131031/57223_1 /ASSEMBLY_ACC=CAM_ASM_000338 /TAXON_ID=268821 /ORGANISM="Scrippsiella Hangoei, Strain SHTV-5" /LENGTH=1370 /DNA_ID=CAMNT_0050843241 /DNA_START=19 /DNA_END=4131 /DNA_ORIENTATION=-